METFVVTISIIIFLLFLLHGILSVITLRKIKINKESITKETAEYHELNFKINTLIFSSVIIVSIGGFLGYSSISSIQKEVGKDVEYIRNYKDTITIVRNSLDSLSKEYRLSSKTYFITKTVQRVYDKDYNPVDIKVNFKDYKNLPHFEKPPTVLIIPKGIGHFALKQVTSEHFIFQFNQQIVVSTEEKRIAKEFNIILVNQM